MALFADDDGKKMELGFRDVKDKYVSVEGSIIAVIKLVAVARPDVLDLSRMAVISWSILAFSRQRAHQ